MTEQVLQGTQTPREGRFLLPLSSPLALLATAALIAAWLAPNHYPPWTSFHGEAAAFAALLLFLLSRLARPEPLVIPRAPRLILCLIPLIGAQWIAGQIPYGGDALVSILYVGGFALAWGLGASMSTVREVDSLRWLATLVTLAASVSVLVALLQWLRMETVVGIYAADRGPDMRAFGNLAQPNQLATLILMGTALASALYVRGVIKGWHLAALLVWLAFGLTLTESRSGLLGAAVAGAFVLWKRREVGKLGDWRLVAGWWALLILLALLWHPLNEWLYLQPPVHDTPLGGDSGRVVMWRQVIAGIGQSPWFGYGWRESIIAQRAGAHFVSGWSATDYAHDLVLDLVAWVGVPLGLALAGIGAWWAIRAGAKARGSSQVVLYAAILPLLVHSLFEFPFAYSYFLFPAGWILGALDAAQSPIGAGPRISIRWTLAIVAVVVVWGGICFAVAREYILLEEDYRVMRFELRRVGARPPGYEAPQVHLLTQLEEMIRAGRIVARPGMAAADIERLRVASNAFGWATLNLSYAVSLGLNGQPEEASRQLQLAHATYGELTYADLRRIFRELQRVFPQLDKVKVP